MDFCRGELLTIEVAAVKGKGKFITTGSLGDVMKESITTAMTVVRTRADELGIEASRFEETDVHVHLPEGATPKDGPSAGLALTTALVSAFTGIAIRPDIAMTGETSLGGRAMRIGGLKRNFLLHIVVESSSSLFLKITFVIWQKFQTM